MRPMLWVGACALALGVGFLLVRHYFWSPLQMHIESGSGDIPSAPHVKITVIDLIPESMSFETNQDSEPNLAINPSNIKQLAASALTENPAGSGNAPIFVSADGGATWTACPIIQSELRTADITLRFTRNRLYAGILRLPDKLHLNIQSTDDFLDCSTPMTIRVDRNQVDQPYVQATDSSGSDRVYVGNNDFDPTLRGRTATTDATLAGPSGFSSFRIERRATSGQDSPPIRPAIGPNNVVYAAFIANRNSGAEVIVVRDDSGGVGPNAFGALKDSDGQPGVRIDTGLTIPFENFPHTSFGQERMVASDLSITVHPLDAARVCVAWGDRRSGAQLTLHLRCSSDSGRTWKAGAQTASDVRTVANARAPALAFNSSGVLGFLWQELDGNGTDARWVTHFERFDVSYKSVGNNVLASTKANSPPWKFMPYLGDFEHVMAAGETFFGIFAASNVPDRRNFPSGVTYQRHADFDHQLLLDGAGNKVAPSIDPFVFIVAPQ
jgi:hypothetical protein